jgi:toxin ParE1/3/4
MGRVTRTAQARADIKSALNYLYDQSPHAAIRLQERLHGMCALLSEHPLMGAKRDHLREGLRSFVVDRYVIFYFPKVGGGIRVVRFLHGSRDIAALFRDEPRN